MALVSAGPLADLPTSQCVSIANGRAIVARLGDTAVSFANRCLHQASPLADGITKGGVLVCPLHFWRYSLPSGGHIGSEAQLPRYETRISEGIVWVEVPDEAPVRTMREQLLEQSREWERS